MSRGFPGRRRLVIAFSALSSRRLPPADVRLQALERRTDPSAEREVTMGEKAGRDIDDNREHLRCERREVKEAHASLYRHHRDKIAEGYHYHVRTKLPLQRAFEIPEIYHPIEREVRA